MSGITPDGAEFTISPPLGAPGWGVIIKHESGSDDVSIIAVSSGFGTAQVPGSERLTVAEEIDKLGEIMCAVSRA
jgi:hypothetical protein